MPRTRLVLEYAVDYGLPEELCLLRIARESAAKLGKTDQIAAIDRLIADAEAQIAEYRLELSSMAPQDLGLGWEGAVPLLPG